MIIDDHHDVSHGDAARAAHVPARQILRDRVDVVDLAVSVRRDHAVTNRLQRDLRAFLFFENSCFGTLAFGDVSDRALVCNDLAVVIFDGARILENDDFAAVLAAQAILKILHNVLRFESCENAFSIDRIHIQYGRFAGGLQVRDAFVAQHLNQCRICSDDIAFA